MSDHLENEEAVAATVMREGRGGLFRRQAREVTELHETGGLRVRLGQPREGLG